MGTRDVTLAEALEIAVGHHRAGRLAEAEALYRRVLTEHPDLAEALNLLGVIQHQCGQHSEAAGLIRRAIGLQPDRADFRVHLAVTLAAMGQTPAAVEECRHALALQPQLPEAHYNLSLWLAELQRPGEALHGAREAIRLRPEHPDAHFHAGNVLASLDRLEEATEAYATAIRQRPEHAEAHYNLGNMLAKRGEESAAVTAFRTAVQLRPDFADAHYNLGNALHRTGDLDAAAAAYEAALRAQPQHTSALYHLGNVCKDRGQLSDALTLWRRALAIDPGDAALHSTLLLYLRYDPASTEAAIADEENRWNERHAAPLRALRTPHTRTRDPERPLRIGYVSPDFWDHAVGRNVLPLLAAHDRGNFEIFCYSGATRADAVTERLRGFADHWCDTTRMSDDALATRVREDEVDILVDLALHTGGNRLLVFARQPAPVQFSFAGYPGGTGVETIAHRISDPHLEGGGDVPPTTHLIDSFWCFDPVELEIAVNPLPALELGHVTFGCLNHPCKVNQPVLALWAQVLRECAGSRLLLLSPPGHHRAWVVEALRNRGIAVERVEFVPPAARADYMRRYHRVDVVLDTFPYGGHTTSLEALWMGVPFVTLQGEAPVARAGVSQLSNLDLPELIARDADDFVRIATELAADRARLAKLRRTLRSRMERSVLMDATRFARGIEKAYRTAWRQWCAGAES